MKNYFKTFLYLSCVFLIVLACTKHVGLITEIEFQLSEVHTAEGFVAQDLETIITIVPEAELEDLEYNITYELLEGDGYFVDEEGMRWEADTEIDITSEVPMTTALTYIGNKVGEQRVKITAVDNFGMSQEIEIIYVIRDTPVRWEASSDFPEIELGTSVDISLLLEILDNTQEVTYEGRFESTTGTGMLSPSIEGGFVLEGGNIAITPGDYSFVYTPSELGPQELIFILRDSNGQEIREVLTIDVVERLAISAITVSQQDPDAQGAIRQMMVMVLPANASEPDINWMTSNSAIATVDQNGLVTGLAAGTVTITATSTSDPEISGEITIEFTAVSLLSGNGVTAFELPGQDDVLINSTTNVITVTVPDGTDLENIAPSIFNVSEGATVSPLISEPQDFNNPVVYTVTAGNGTIRVWTVNTTVTANLAPNVDAGTNTTITLPDMDAELSGSATDEDGTITAYSWSLVSGPGTATIVTPDAAATTVSNLSQLGTYVFRLIATDDDNASAGATVSVTVDETENEKPTAVATSDIADGNAPLIVTFTGDQSNDPDGNVLTYFWDFDDDGQTSTVANPTHTFENQGTYNVTLVVTDGNNADSTPSTIRITVDVTRTNEFPVAVIEVGPNQGSGTAPHTVDFIGSGSNDPDGTIATYAWDFGDGTTSTEADPSHTFNNANPNADGFDVRLVVTDNDGADSQLATIRVTVIEAENMYPSVDAGTDISITLPDSVVELSGSASDEDGSIISYLWTLDSGPVAATIQNPQAATTTVSGLLEPGRYDFNLTVTDDDGAVSSATVSVTVLEDTRSGENNITQFTLSPTSGDANLDFVNHTASITVPFDTDLVVAPTNLVVSPNAIVSPGANEEQDFSGPIEYTVTAQNGEEQIWTVMVTVTNENRPPMANARLLTDFDITSLTRSFSGSLSSDPDGDNLNYQWNFRDFNNPLDGAFGEETTWSFSNPGTYDVTLTVTDGNGETASDTITVIVEPSNVVFDSNLSSINISDSESFRRTVEGTVRIVNSSTRLSIIGIGLGNGTFTIDGKEYSTPPPFSGSTTLTDLLPVGQYDYTFSVSTSCSGLECGASVSEE